jgi:hypothetical protein
MSSEDQKCIRIHPKCAEILMTVTITQLPSFGTKLWQEQHLAEKVYLQRVFCCKIGFVERLCAQNLMDMLYAMEFGPENCKLSTYE